MSSNGRGKNGTRTSARVRPNNTTKSKACQEPIKPINQPKKYDYIRKTARVNGKKISAYGKTEREAYMKLSRKIEEEKHKEEALKGDISVDEWFDTWLETYKEPTGLTAKSLLMYKQKYTNHIEPYIGKMKLKDVKDIHLQKILNEQAGMSASHVSKVRLVLKELFKRARQSRLIQYDPAELLILPQATKGQRRSLTDKERDLLLRVADYHKNGLWILTLLYTGMRPGESAVLRWEDVDFQKNEIHVHAAKESGYTHVKGTKTQSGVRDIPIHSELLKRLQAAFTGKSGLVFPNHAGEVPDDSTIRRWWMSFLREMDIQGGAVVYRNKVVQTTLAPDLKLYCLRHTFCTDLQKAGVPLNVAKELMGHSSISVTANIYTHKDNETLHANMRLLEKATAKNGAKK